MRGEEDAMFEEMMKSGRKTKEGCKLCGLKRHLKTSDCPNNKNKPKARKKKGETSTNAS